MEYFGKIRCVTIAELTAGDPKSEDIKEQPIMTRVNYDNYVQRKKIIVARPGKGKGSYALIDFNSLPDDIRERYNAKYPNAENVLKEQLMSETITDDKAAREFFAGHILENGEHISDEKQAEYLLNAEVLNQMRKKENETQAYHHKLNGKRKTIVWEIVLGTCEKLRAAYKHTLPPSEVSLKKKFAKYKKEGYVTLVSGKLANQNTRKVGTAEGRFLLKLKRSHVPTYNDQQIYETFNLNAMANGWKQLQSINTVHNYLNDPKIMRLWYAAVYGDQAWKNKYGVTLSTEMPSMRDALWYSDGTKLNLYYRDAENKMRTTCVYEVMDAYSELFLGYDIAPGEKFDSQYRAFHMAVSTSKHRPYELVYDNQGGHKKLGASGLLGNIARVNRPTMPYNGQSKTIESAFGRFQSQVLHKIWHFTGMNITTKSKKSRPNLEFIEANPHKLPTLEELKVIYAECRKEWNTNAHPATGLARKDMYDMSYNPETSVVDELAMIQIFWMTSKEPIEYKKEGITMELDKVKYKYQVYDAYGQRDESFAAEHTGRKLYIKYDPMDMTLVRLYKEIASGMVEVGMATPLTKVHRAIQEQTPEDSKLIRSTINEGKRVRAFNYFRMEDFDRKEGVHPELYGMVSPTPKGISKEELERYRKEYEQEKREQSKKQECEPEYELVEAGYDEPQTLGQSTKMNSNITFDTVRRQSKY